MTSQQILLQLWALDQQIAQWQEQFQRDGLAGFRQRRERAQQSHQSLQERLSSIPRLLQQCQEQLESPKIEAQERSQLEDQSLALMFEEDQIRPQLPLLEQEITEVGEELLAAQADEEERQLSLQQRLQQGQTQRQAWLEQLPADIAKGYQRSSGTSPLALGRGGRCERCRLGLPDHLQRLLRNHSAVLCPHCQVVLVQSLD